MRVKDSPSGLRNCPRSGSDRSPLGGREAGACPAPLPGVQVTSGLVNGSWPLSTEGPSLPGQAACFPPTLALNLHVGRPGAWEQEPVGLSQRLHPKRDMGLFQPRQMLVTPAKCSFVNISCHQAVGPKGVCERKAGPVDSPMVASRPILLMVENM